MSAQNLSVAHWITNLSFKTHSLDEWFKMTENLIRDAHKNGADIFMMPESVNEQWCHFMPEGTAGNQELAWMASLTPALIDRYEALAQELNMAIIVGSLPHDRGDGQLYNRAWMVFPDRPRISHDKLVLTPGEKNPDDWFFTPGERITIIEWRGVRMAILVCLDIEQPHTAHLLSDKDIDLILVPSMTGKVAGYNRVFDCAKARAVELMCAVSVTGMLGKSHYNGKDREQHAAGASVYIPCEVQFGESGVFAITPVALNVEGPGEVMIAKNIPLAEIRTCRHGQPEAWPGPFDASHVKISEE
jgi:predicted amidohydrolase